MAQKIKHVVVLMMENRSFDNLLGWLYNRENDPPYKEVPTGQTFEGLDRATKEIPWRGKMYGARHGTDMTQPYPDPNEEYAFMYRQMFDKDFDPKKHVPDKAGQMPAMDGYMTDYETAVTRHGGDLKQVEAIMNCFRPTDVPVISQLANSFTVCDHWYASLPSQTLANRCFVHAGTSRGHVNNSSDATRHASWVSTAPTIFSMMKKANIAWRIYYGGSLSICNAFLTHLDLLELAPDHHKYFFDNNTFEDYVRNVKEEEFPSYIFIEPTLMAGRRWGPQDDEHPQSFKSSVGGPSNVLWGEDLIARMFNALTANTKLWASTMFVLLFDECGGLYDHYPPQPTRAIPPDNVVLPEWDPYYTGFKFDRYGARVPAIVCSPYTKKAQVSNAIYDHTSVLKTLNELFLGGKAGLGARTASANSLLPLVSEPTFRTDTPVLKPRPTPPHEPDQIADMPLSGLQETLVAGALNLAKTHYPQLYAAFSQRPYKTHADAWALIESMEKEMP
jgi:phospholipase C